MGRSMTIQVLLVVAAACCCSAFAPSPLTRSSQFQGTPLTSRPVQQRPQQQHKSSSLCMFLGSEGGILGVGTPEVFTILLVGYFVLGPSDLYKLVKSVGKGIQNFRTLSSDVSKTFENNMESQFQLDELRKAQQELNEAFSFRRSINVDDEAEAFATTPAVTEEKTSPPPTVEDSGGAPKKKKKRRRVKKKKEEEANGSVPDLDMPPLDDTLIREEEEEAERLRMEEAEAERVRAERMERLQSGTQQPQPTETVLSETTAEEQDRFAKQLSDDWNAQILANEDKLSPLSKVMERLAILEEEKIAADKRLEEEFRLRTELEEKYYREKRDLLEEAAAQVQAEAYVSLEADDKTTTTTTANKANKKTA